MGNVPVLKPREVSRILENLGFIEVRQRGSHKQYRYPDGHSLLVFPVSTSGKRTAHPPAALPFPAAVLQVVNILGLAAG